MLAHWGVTRTEDFGRIVFTLVEVGLLVTQPGDREDDFAGVFDFAEAFGDVVRLAGRVEAREHGGPSSGGVHGEDRDGRRARSARRER